MARKSKKPADMSALFQSTTGTLAQIQRKTNSLAILADIVRQICPDLPEDVWKIANFHSNTLIIEVKSPVWSQRLQFERMKICRQLQIETDNQFQQIEIMVNPHQHRRFPSREEKDKPVKSQVLSQKTAEQLLAVADNAPKGLKEKLEKLAKHVKK